jgi:hypothetical protein
MRHLRFLFVLVLLAAFISVQDSKAQAIQEFEVKSFDRYYFDCLGEGGAGSITFHHLYLYDKSGDLKALHSNIVEGWFVGAESGTVYKVIDTHKYSQQTHKNNLQQTSKYQISFKLISPKNGKSFPGYANLQETYNALGEMTVYRWEIDLCFEPPKEE